MITFIAEEPKCFFCLLTMRSWGSAQRMYDGVFKDREARVVNLGLFGFQDYRIADRIGQYKRKLLLNTVYQGIEIPFLWEKETFLSEKNIPAGLLMRGTTCASLQNNSDNSSMSKPAETPYLTQNTELSSFQTFSMRQVICKVRHWGAQQFSAPTPWRRWMCVCVFRSRLALM